MPPVRRNALLGSDAEASVPREVWQAVEAATGRDLSAYRADTARRALGRRLAATGAASIAAYLERLRADGAEAHALVDELFVGVTAFFRDEEVFAGLAERVLPQLVEEARPAGALRVWVPGCATGEEAYSLAMLALSAAQRAAAPVRPVVFATDVDEAALDVARAGRYARQACARVPPELLARYLREERGELAATSELRDACVFARHDLVRDPPFSRLDLVSCRNVLIYFDGEARARALAGLHGALRPGGMIVLGPAEGILRHESPLEVVDAALRVYRRKAGGPAAAAALAPRRRERDPARRPAVPPPAGRVHGEPGMIGEFEQVLLREIAPACVVVDAGGNVLHYSGPVGRYLEPQGAPSTSLLDLARDGVRLELRQTLRRAIAERQAVRQDCVACGVDGRRELTEVVVRPLASAGATPERYLVAFRELRVVGEPDGAAGEAPADERLRAELVETRQRLQATIDELEASNAEHRRANERLRALNEELQISQEELESLNEELQTVNAELASKVEELDRANGDLQNLLRSTDVAAVFVAADLRLLKFTPAATRLFRLVDADVGRPIADVSARFPIDELVADVREVLGTLAPRERSVRVADTGRWYALRVLPYVTVAGATDGVVVTFADVTEAKVAEAASREREARLRQIVDTVPHLVWTATADGRRDYFSQQWREYTGLTAGPQLDEGWTDAYHPDDREAMLAAWDEAVRTGRPFQAEYRIRRHDGGYRWFRARANPLRDAAGQVERWIGTSTDVDELKRLESSLREGSRRKDEFMALLGHELRNPLAPLGNCLDLLRRRGGDREQVARAVTVIDRQVTHLTRLVDDLLDLSRITRGKIRIRRERLDLAAQLVSILDDHRELLAAAGLHLECEAAAEPLWIAGDPARIAQMVGNLLHNARKFTERGGTVKVTLAPSPDGGSVSLRVRDTGIGMDPASVEGMFEAFVQADATLAHSRGGLGLGLTLVKALAELHGGQVRGSSPGVGKGSEFELQFPLVGAPALAWRPPERASSRRILVVDDNADAAETFAELLRLDGHEVRVAGDGESGLREARSFRPEVAFCDIGLPGALDGYALARALRADPGLEATVLVAMTGYAGEEDQRRTREAGFALHLAKPVRIDVVRRAIAALTADDAGRAAPPPEPSADEHLQ